VDKPLVYVSVYGGIADAQTYPKERENDVEIILIDWDNYEDNLAEVDTVLSHIEDTKRLVEAGYEGAWLDMDRALDRSGGVDLEQYSDEDAAMIIDALEKAGHPYELSEDGRQIPLLSEI
jgi:hypothetical protein